MCKHRTVYALLFVKSDGVFPFSDGASLLTRGTENVQDTVGPIAVFFAMFHIRVVLFMSIKRGPYSTRKTMIG